MDYVEFHRRLGKAGLTIREFASLLKMNPNSIVNYGNRGVVPSHLAVIAALLAELGDRGIEFRTLIDSLDLHTKQPRGAPPPNRFGRAK